MGMFGQGLVTLLVTTLEHGEGASGRGHRSDSDQIPIRFRVFGQKPQAAPFRRSASARRLYSIQGFQPDAAVRANASRLHLALIEKLSQGAARNTEHAGSFAGC